MERQTSISKRLRKVSDPLIQLITPSSSSSHGHGKAGPEDSFFDYGKKGWRAPKPPDSYLRRRPLYRKVSKEEIRYPLLHPTEDMHELLVESATMSAERDKQRAANRPPERPPRPSLDERPLVVRDPQLRMEEQRVYRSVNTAKRPERPREEDLPYGAKGSIPRALMSPEQPPPPPAIGRRSERTREYSVAFPSSRDEGARAQDPPQKTFTPFAPLSPRDAHHTRYQDRLQQPPQSARSLPDPRSNVPAGAPGLRRNATVPEIERRPKPPPKDAKWLAAAATASATAHTALPSHAQSHARRMRRTSSSGDVMLPSHSTRHQPPAPQVLQVQDGNVPRHARTHPPELRTVKSTPLSGSPQQSPPPPPPPPPSFHAFGLPAHPAVHLDPKQSRHRHKPSNPDVPRDVTLAEALHPGGRSFDATAAAAHEHVRVGSHTALGMRPAPPDRAQERERERKRRREERERAAAQERSQYYGKADAFARQITLALAEPERAGPLSADWDAFVAGGVEYRTRPLVVTRKTKDREPRERYPRGGY